MAFILLRHQSSIDRNDASLGRRFRRRDGDDASEIVTQTLDLRDFSKLIGWNVACHELGTLRFRKLVTVINLYSAVIDRRLAGGGLRPSSYAFGDAWMELESGVRVEQNG